ncbi:MAG TPA: response regulator [Candidatus Saccharimonadia bacterium]|nr:response regulator [Candidatus Saccharimonadia bacterium]
MTTILIIEDDAQIAKLYQEALKAAGFAVVIAPTGNQGLSDLTKIKPNLVILDIMLAQGMNGFDILEKMKKNPSLKAIPVIVLTNLDSEQKVALEIGAAAYMVKSNTSLEEIVAKVKQLTS